MTTCHILNPLSLPLSGMQLIEASAGTGKTWTLAALYVRLVLGHGPGAGPLTTGLFPPQILVMTFTEAATAELRERIRARLAQAARFFATGDAPGADDFLRELRNQIAPELWPLCAWRLDMAAQWMDEAAIFTIHGWSSRMLRTHAFDSASLFTQTRVEDGERQKLLAVQDYWRHWFYALDAQALTALQGLGETPQALMDKLKSVWRMAERAPQADAEVPDAPDTLLARWALWQQRRTTLEGTARLAWTPEVIEGVRDAARAKRIKGLRQDYLEGWLDQMAAWAQGGEIDPKTLARFTTVSLCAKGWSQAAGYPAFDQLEALHDHLSDEPDVATQVLAHAAVEVARSYQQAKAQKAQFDFSDLLQNLYHALQAPEGRLAEAIRAQYPVALVDEFQDTDPWQFGSLVKIYSDKSSLDVGLIMIGDPKQAIYSFRGADLATYLAARGRALGIYNLPGNFRSTAGVVAAVNHVFGQAAAPFGSVPFVPVVACNQNVQPLQVAGQAQVAMTVWHLPYTVAARKDVFMTDMAALFATQMVRLLQAGAAQPGDMAVLVRDWSEAAAVREALTARGVRSVYLSERSSVYASEQATDLWRLLRAVANPGANRLVRAALATRSWGLPWAELDDVFANELSWDGVVDQFMQWQRVWRTQGFLPMLHRMLHDQGLAARLLRHSTQGERALTNLLHLGELLQAASLELQGEGALIRYLEDQLRRPQASGDSAQLRLESDAHLVQVVTLHKSKGLEYPLVFLPFVSNYRAEDKGSDRPDQERLAEDIRLLYVALTRARQAVWLGVAPVRGDLDGKTPQVRSALSALLGRSTPADLSARLHTWAGEHIAVLPAPAPAPDCYAPTLSSARLQPARVPQRLLGGAWWSASFSALTRGIAHAGAAGQRSTPGLSDERDEQLADAQLDAALPQANAPLLDAPGPGTDLLGAEPQFNAFPASSSYGTLLHDLLEWQARNGWPAATPSPSPDWQALLTRQSQRLKLPAEHQTLLDGWVRQIIGANMPVVHTSQSQHTIQLGAIEAPRLWPEMGFVIPVHSLASNRLDKLISRQVWPHQDRPALQRRQLEGMLTGFMDVVFCHAGRYYVLDYKSNRLASYEQPQLQQAMLAHRYDVQATLYLLALHRLLKSRLPGYNYDQHVGGALYLFLRGVDQPGAGLLQLSPPCTVIESLDAAFSQSWPGETA